ncbi:hypothetical protein ALP16_101655 [Pseudomonas savastanoi]|uniref:Uncharacterized protein n=1 Tax=Pseudomonas savastanoi TaxID=29438 RepID=A0A3M6AFG3_PSESS|nr:hypothetical protein ALP16_101655 [Pseudomonas savastanoi]
MSEEHGLRHTDTSRGRTSRNCAQPLQATAMTGTAIADGTPAITIIMAGVT